MEERNQKTYPQRYSEALGAFLTLKEGENGWEMGRRYPGEQSSKTRGFSYETLADPDNDIKDYGSLGASIQATRTLGKLYWSMYLLSLLSRLAAPLWTTFQMMRVLGERWGTTLQPYHLSLLGITLGLVVGIPLGLWRSVLDSLKDITRNVALFSGRFNPIVPVDENGHYKNEGPLSDVWDIMDFFREQKVASFFHFAQILLYLILVRPWSNLIIDLHYGYADWDKWLTQEMGAHPWSRWLFGDCREVKFGLFHDILARPLLFLATTIYWLITGTLSAIVTSAMLCLIVLSFVVTSPCYQPQMYRHLWGSFNVIPRLCHSLLWDNLFELSWGETPDEAEGKLTEDEVGPLERWRRRWIQTPKEAQATDPTHNLYASDLANLSAQQIRLAKTQQPSIMPEYHRAIAKAEVASRLGAIGDDCRIHHAYAKNSWILWLTDNLFYKPKYWLALAFLHYPCQGITIGSEASGFLGYCLDALCNLVLGYEREHGLYLFSTLTALPGAILGGLVGLPVAVFYLLGQAVMGTLNALRSPYESAYKSVTGLCPNIMDRLCTSVLRFRTDKAQYNHPSSSDDLRACPPT